MIVTKNGIMILRIFGLSLAFWHLTEKYI
jgi:hypothetical protein